MTDIKTCPQCNKPIEKSVSRTIIFRDRDQYGRAFVNKKTMDFCSEECGTHHQWAHEG